MTTPIDDTKEYQNPGVLQKRGPPNLNNGERLRAKVMKLLCTIVVVGVVVVAVVVVDIITSLISVFIQCVAESLF